MEALLLVILCFTVFWLVLRQFRRDDRDFRIDDLARHLDNMEHRLRLVEDHVRRTLSPQAAAVPAPNPPPAAPVVSKPEVAEPHSVTAAKLSSVPGFPGFEAQPAPAQPTPSVPPPPPPAAPSTQEKIAVPAPAEARPPVPPPPPPAFAAAAEPKPHISLEQRLGQNWLNKLGIVTLVIGLALFLGYQLHNLGPVGKSLTGLALSATLLVGGILLERRPQYRIFARAAIGGGWALTFFVSFALYHVTAMKVLNSQAADLVLMMAVAGAMVWHSLKYKSQVVTSLAFLLAFLTVGISEVTLFSLVAGIILALGLIYVAARERWYELALCGIVGAYLNHFLWLQRVLPLGIQPNMQPAQPFPDFLPSAALLLAFWLLFRLFYVFCVPKTHRQEVVSSLAAVLNSVGVMSLLKYQSTHPEWAFYALLALGAAELVFAFIARPRFRSAFVLLSCIGSALMVAAIPFRFGGASWSLMWLTQAEILFVAGLTLREGVLRRLGIAASLAAALQWMLVGVAPIFELRQSHTDAGFHLAVVLAGFLAVALFWFNAEVAPRRWRFLLDNEFDLSSLVFTSYAALALFAVTLWVAVPFAWTAVAWLLAALLLGFLTDKLSSSDFAAQADMLSLIAIVRCIGVNLSMSGEPHWGVLTLRALTTGIAAVLLYANMRRKTVPAVFTFHYVSAFYSWSASMLLAALLWFELAPLHLALAWGLFGLALFELGLFTKLRAFCNQSYLLLTAAFACTLGINLFPFVTQSAATASQAILTVVSLSAIWLWTYMRLTAKELDREFGAPIAPLLTWFSTLSIAALLWQQLNPLYLSLVWGVLGLVLLEAGLGFRRLTFRVQSYTLTALTFARLFLYDLNVSGNAHLSTARILTAVVLAAIWMGSYFRLSLSQHTTKLEQQAAPVAAWLAIIASSFFLWIEAAPAWLSITWAALSLTLLALGSLTKRTVFVAQSMALLVAVVLHAALFDLYNTVAFAHTAYTARTFAIAGTSALLLLALPFAYRIRKQHAEDNATGFALLFYRPEQTFFFTPFALLTALLTVELRTGMITVGWAALGVATFLFALTVKERSYRLAGLGLLLLGVAKILIVDIWQAAPTERYLTLIVTGAALLLVSFLYSRYKETILKFL